jgi:N-acetyl-gamma-glutamyl-phosphate reductase
MSAYVFVDGDQGTTGLEIVARLSGRNDISLVTLDDKLRKDAAARSEAINSCDVAILCLPDDAARHAIGSIRNSRVRVIDASSAHRTKPNWVYGLPELSSNQPERIAQARRVSNPGCYPTGAIALLRPLVEAGYLRTEVSIAIHAVSGYSGKGREGINLHENPNSQAQAHLSFQTYGLDLNHKHVPEIQMHAGLQSRPFFLPSYGSYRQGISLTIPLHAQVLQHKLTTKKLQDLFSSRYRAQHHVHVIDDEQTQKMSHLDPQSVNGQNELQLAVFGSDEHEHFLLSAVFDNLGKGASGAAVQNLELMLDLNVRKTLLSGD